MSQSEKNMVENMLNLKEWSDDIPKAFKTLRKNLDPQFIKTLVTVIEQKPSNNWINIALKTIPYYSKVPEMSTVRQKILKIAEEFLELNYPIDIRWNATTVFGALSTWPDPVLRKVILKDPERFVRLGAFTAILEQLKLPESVIADESEKAAQEDIEPDFNEINRITQARADGKYDHLE